MTVANNYAPVKYTGNGVTTEFTVDWRLESGDDFVVYQNIDGGESVVDPDDYTAFVKGEYYTDPENPGNTIQHAYSGVIFNTAPANGTIIVLTRLTPQEQDTPYKTSSGFPADRLEDDFDELTMMVQEMQQDIDRAVKVNVTSDINPETLVNQVERIYTSIDNVDAVADDITNVNTVALNISNVNDVADNETNINAVAGNETNINAVAGDSANINAVATHISQVNTVAGRVSDVTKVADSISDVHAVAINISDIHNLAPYAYDVHLVGNNINDVVTAANDINKIVSVANNSTNINTVATNISDVNDVVDNISNVNAVANNETNINNVATNISDIEDVADNILNVNAVANNETNINAVNANKINIDTVAGVEPQIIALAQRTGKIDILSASINNIDTVATNIGDVHMVAGNIADVDTVATNIVAVHNVAGNETNINTVAGDSANINAVAADLTNIDTAVANLASIDAAPTYAAEAKQWAIGDPSEPTGNSAKYWADTAAATLSGKANTDLSNISGTSTKSIDGQWVQANETIASDVSWTGDGQSVTYSVSSFLPNDNYIYECMITAFCTTSNTSAKFIDVQLSSDVLTNSINVCHIRTRTSSTVDSSGNIILPVGTGRYITQKGSASSNADGTYSLYLRGYRRVGTNT